MNQLTTRTTAVFATAMIAMIILGFAAVMTVSAQTEPERPTDLTATAVDHDTVSLTWSHTDPASVDHYRVLSRRVGSGAGQLTQVGTSTTTSFQHDGLEPESTYVYRVKPVNSEGEEGKRSARAEATTPAEETPTPEPEPEPTPASPERSDQQNTRSTHATAHVSNIGQTSNTGTINFTSSISHAQGFTTGSQSGGYTLSTVGMQFTDGSVTATGLVVAIYSAAAGGGPDSAVYTLTNPSRLENDGTTESLFTAPANSTLSADTTYFVVATTGISNNYSAQGTSETDEDSGASTGWSIADTRYFRNTAFSNNWSTSAPKIKIAIYPPSTTTLSTDATLSDLELEDDSGTDITLTPTFASATTTYTANVVNSVDEITITPTMNDSTASYEIQNSAGTALTDTDTAIGFQVDLLVGANIIKVEVTAEDATTQTYTVTVTRATAATPTVSISADKTSAVFKEDGITYTLARAGSTTAALPVSVTLTQTKDFLDTATLNKTVTIDVGQSTKTFSVQAATFQSFAAGTTVESGTLTATVQDGTDYDLGTSSSVTVAIVIGVMVRIEDASYTVNEADGTLTVKLIARTGQGAPQPSSATSHFEQLTENGTATKGTDFTFANASHTFTANSFSADGSVWEATRTASVSITNDARDENDETFNFALRHPPGSTSFSLVDTSGNSCGTKCTALVTITDDDTAGVTVSKSALTVTEQDTTGDTYTVVLDSKPTADVRIEIGWHVNSDVSVVPHIMTFTPTNWATAQTATVTAGDDADTTNDTDSLIHLAVSTDTNYSGITIAGVAVTVNDNDDATLSALVLQDASDNSVLTLDPTFDAATLEYAATVADGVDEITIIPTPNDTGASYETQDSDGNALTDADTSQDDFQVSVSRGLSTIQIEVTSEDDLTTQTYTVTMNRPQVLVSNINKSQFTSQNVGNSGGSQTKIAQKFTTGDNAEGYTVDSVSIYLNHAGHNAMPVLTINTSDGDNPGTVIYTLINPGNIDSGQIAFAAPAGATLDAETAYIIVIANSNTNDSNSARYQVDNTDSNNEDNNTLPNWSIANVGRINTGVWVPTTGDGANKIQIRGRIGVDAAIAASDATLSALVLQDASDDSVLTLDPTFDAATLEYVATVGRDVVEVTIIPTPNDTSASYEIQDGDGTALTDADTTKDEFQVSIARGLNAIQIEVTAEDTTTQTYTVTVTRPRILVSNTGKPDDAIIYTGGLPAGHTKQAQKFTTGSNTSGYTLDEIKIDLFDIGADAGPSITINAANANVPGTPLYTLSNPATFTNGVNSFGAPAGATLAKDTDYFVVMQNTNTMVDSAARYAINATDTDTEDNSGLSDWSIANSGSTTSGTTWSDIVDEHILQIQVRGTVNVGTPATLPELSFDDINITVDEDGSQATLSLELSQASADTVTVDYATSDITAEAGDDYTESSGTLTFAPGETVMAIIVPILDDAIYEPTERFDVTLSNPTGATLPAFPGARVNIAEDESPPTASIANVTVGEDAGTMTLTLNLSHESSRSTPYRTQTSYIGGTATQGADYENFLSGGEARITVPAGDTQATLDIAITDDTAAESSETITIRWDNDPTGVSKGDATPATINFTGTITDNDSGVQLTIQDASADESNSSIFFTIDSSETLTQDVTFDYSTSIGASDSAEADDFDPASALSHTLEAGSVRGLIDIDLNDDNVYEGDETFTVTISNPVNASIADATATGTITDDETQPTLEVYETSATEGDDIVFLVDHAGPLTEDDVTFDYATSIKSDDTAETGDFTTTNGTGTITAGNTATIITVPTDDDGLNNDTTSTYEGDETFTVTISNPTVAGISQATAKGTILDDERLPTVKFIANNRVTAEHTGSIIDFIEFSVVPKGEQSAQVSLTIAGTATRNDDYTITSTTLTVSANQSQFGTQITLLNDNVAEVTETVIITIVAASTNIQVDPDFSTRTLTIEDDDDHPTVGFTSESFDVDEDAGHAVLTVNKTGLSDFPVHVEYETVSRDNAVAGDDYVATSGTLTFQPNETSKTISVPIIDNNVYQINDKIFDVDLDLSSLSPHGTDPILEPDNTVVYIGSEDPVPTASMADVTANERAGTMTVTLMLSHPSHEDIQYIVNDSSVTGTATRDEDYVHFIPGVQAYITVSAGQLSGHFDITLIDDGLEEEDENIHIRWIRRGASMVNPQYVDFNGTITDDADRPRGPTNLTATPDGANKIDLTWQAPTNIGTSNISGYGIQSSPNGISNWTDLVANTYRTITNYSDSGLAPGTTRHYRIRAINASGAGSASNVASATTADKTVSFGAAQYTASENGATARVTVELSAAVDVTIPIRVQHRDGARSADYSGVPRRLIFEDGTTTRSFTVTAVDDSDNDDGESLRIEFRDLPAVVGAGTRSFTTVKLKDNDGGNSLPAFDPANEIRNLVENTAPNQNVGLPITATDADGDSLTYTFSGPDMDRFTFVPSTAQMRTKSGQTYDYETHQLFVVRVTADDGNGGTKTATVVIRVRDMAEPPSTPSRLTTLQVNPTSMVVSWTPPNNTGRPDITGYDVQYRKSSETAWTPGPQAVTDTNAALTGLEPSTTYYVQVRANNDEGDSPWTSTLSRSTRSLSPGIAITKTSVTVTEGNTTTYFIVLGSQPTTSVRVSLSGYGSTAVSISQNYHIFNTEDWNTPKAVTVTASEDADSRDKTVTIDHSVTTDDTDYAAITIPSLTVTIIDDDTPQVDGVSIQPGYEQLTVNWTAAPNATGYKLQWRRPGEGYDTHTRLITITSGSTTTYTIPDLTNLSTYEVRVAATRTGQNDGPWSEEITGTPAAP